MADESKLKAQAREFLFAKDCDHDTELFFEDARELMAAFAHEQVKAETADLRDELQSAKECLEWVKFYLTEDCIQNNKHRMGLLGSENIESALLLTTEILTKLQENK